MAFSDEMKREAKEEYEAEQRERNRIAYSERPKSTDDFYTYGVPRVLMPPPDDEYSDDPDNHPFDCMCFLCIPGF